MNFTPTQKLIGVAILGVLAGMIITKMSKKGEKKSAFDDVFDNAEGETDFYDFDSDYDVTDKDDFYNVEGETDFYDAEGTNDKRKLAHYQRRVKILTKKITLAKKGLIEAQSQVSKWEAKLTEAQKKVAELSK